MNLPSGLVFFLDFQYGTNKNPFTSGDSMYGARDKASTTPFSTTGTTGGLYGTGRYTYSTNITGGAIATGTGSIATATWADMNFDSSFSSSFANYRKVTLAASGLTNADFDAVRSFTIFSGSVANGTALNTFTTYNGTSVFAIFSTSSIAGLIGAGVTTPNVLVSYSLATADNKRGDFEDGSTTPAGNTNPISIPEINIQMQSQAITAKTKKLKAVWTPEFAQDLNAYQNLDAEAELTNIMSEYISLEIDLEILDMLIENVTSGNTEYWTTLNNGVYNPNSGGAGVGGFDFPTSTTQNGFYNTQGQWFQTLGTKLQKLSNKIHQLTLRGGANFMVVSPTIATIIESIPGFAANSNGDAADMEYAFGVQKAGQFNSRYTVYKNPYMTENTILVGFRGKQFLEAGAVFAPYIPLIMTPLIYDPNTFTPRKGLLTRYAKKMLRPEFYGKILVSGLNSL
jgi:hypothetical protein